MSWTAADIPDQAGRTVVVTGANGGIGLETARELARRGALVVMAVRNQEKAAAAHEAIVADVPEAALEVRRLDLGSLASIRSFAADLLDGHDSIDLLINNAGVMATPQLETGDGFELQFGTNHLGHFALTALLWPAVRARAGARVVTVTSTARHFGKPVDPADPHLADGYDPWRAYGQSKLANMHFAVALDHRLRAAGLTVASLAAHPGYANTDLQAASARSSKGSSQRFFAATVRWVGMPAERGALPQLRAATDPTAGGGELYAPRWANFGPPVRRPIMERSVRQADLDALWAVSERETGVTFDVDG